MGVPCACAACLVALAFLMIYSIYHLLITIKSLINSHHLLEPVIFYQWSWEVSYLLCFLDLILADVKTAIKWPQSEYNTVIGNNLSIRTESSRSLQTVNSALVYISIYPGDAGVLDVSLLTCTYFVAYLKLLLHVFSIFFTGFTCNAQYHSSSATTFCNLSTRFWRLDSVSFSNQGKKASIKYVTTNICGYKKAEHAFPYSEKPTYLCLYLPHTIHECDNFINHAYQPHLDSTTHAWAQCTCM